MMLAELAFSKKCMHWGGLCAASLLRCAAVSLLLIGHSDGDAQDSHCIS